MREIKFRLILHKKIVGYEKWYEGKFSEIDGETANPCWLYSKDNKNWNPAFIWHKQKNQYTGQKDKNGKEIYEGDITKNKREQLGHVIYQEFAFYIVYEWGKDYISNWWELEVIGNIYENPELLKEIKA